MERLRVATPVVRGGEFAAIRSTSHSGHQIATTIPRGQKHPGGVTVVFRGNWAQATGIARTNVQGLQLVEVA